MTIHIFKKLNINLGKRDRNEFIQNQNSNRIILF